jgi:cysteinyl-tRNA synthetase, unknown class
MKISVLSLLPVIIPITLSSCHKNDYPMPSGVDFRKEMRDFVGGISNYSKGINPEFIIIPQNGQELITDTGESDGTIQTDYLNSIDATGREDLFYGYNSDDQPTPEEDKQHMLGLCLLCEQNSVEVLTTDYCYTHSKMDNSYLLNSQNGFISFAADQRNLNDIPSYPAKPYNENTNDITEISQARNFLYLINPEKFNTKQDFISAVSATNYDLVVMDLYHNETTFTSSEIAQLKTKHNGGRRLVICYMSIGEAEDYRDYWQSGWKVGSPAFLQREDPDWSGNYYVRYWDPDWKDIIYGNDDSYLGKILKAGFNGVYLDKIDSFEFFEGD